jgi:hypothetical protein
MRRVFRHPWGARSIPFFNALPLLVSNHQRIHKLPNQFSPLADKLFVIILSIYFHAKRHNVGFKNLLPITLGHEAEDVIGGLLLRYLLI